MDGGCGAKNERKCGENATLCVTRQFWVHGWEENTHTADKLILGKQNAQEICNFTF